MGRFSEVSLSLLPFGQVDCLAGALLRCMGLLGQAACPAGARSGVWPGRSPVLTPILARSGGACAGACSSEGALLAYSVWSPRAEQRGGVSYSVGTPPTDVPDPLDSTAFGETKRRRPTLDLRLRDARRSEALPPDIDPPVHRTAALTRL